MPWVVLIAIAGPFLLSLASTAAIRKWANAIGLIDRPAGHKQHKHPVALGGGIALMLSICGPLWFVSLAVWWLTALESSGTLPEWLPELIRTHLSGLASKVPIVLAITGGALVLHVVGLIDDRRPLGPWPKLVAQITVALIIAWPVGIRAVEFLPAPLSIAVTVVWIVLITNAFNFLDNMDGLSAGVAAVAAAIFALAAMRTGQVFVPMLAWVVVGALCGFLWFNFHPATIFMGDAGSLVIGYLMGVLTVLTTFYDPALGLKPLGVLVPLLVLAVPLYDVTSVVVHRIREGVSPFVGDWRHFSHRLVKRGMTRRGAVLTIYLATAATGLPAIVLPSVDRMGAVLLLAQCGCVVLMIAILEHIGPPPKDQGNQP